MTVKKSIRLEFDESVKKTLAKKAKSNNRTLKNHLETIIINDLKLNQDFKNKK